MKCMQNFLSFWVICCPLYHTNILKNQNFEKMKNMAGDHHFTLVYQNWQLYDVGSWDMEHNRLNFFCHLGLVFALLPTVPSLNVVLFLRYNLWQISPPTKIWLVTYPSPLTAQKNQNEKKWKKHPEISSFYTGVLKTMIMCFAVPEIWHITGVIIFIFCPFTPQTPKKIKILMQWIQHLKTYHFKHMYQKLWSDYVYVFPEIMVHDCMFPEIMVHDWWTDERMKKVTYRDGCPT